MPGNGSRKAKLSKGQVAVLTIAARSVSTISYILPVRKQEDKWILTV